MAVLSVLQPCNEQKQAFGTEITLKYAKGNLTALNVSGRTTQEISHFNLLSPASGTIAGGSADSVLYQSDLSADISIIGDETSQRLIQGGI